MQTCNNYNGVNITAQLVVICDPKVNCKDEIAAKELWL